MDFERKFFTGEFERYRWSKLVAPGVGGQEMLNLYTEALAKMVENADLPELFRAIFRNAFLPYRDPETLRSFLREIDGFTYDHSERLGDAFEYLLSVLGSQGDAGQFRTPRHIIDFMVEIIDPKKDEVILDPACGTAGFLISSYKHILKSNTTAPAGSGGESAEVDAAEATLDSPLRYAGDLLSTDDRQRLANNIRGYDISPDMVRLSLVNLYLHGFLDPKVEEYDTLSSEDKWGDTADVILANPPFMSPKGGIRPHNRFQVQSKRSEVLFVDYIAEHLNPNGRAAIVVPEGIIFQSQTAYVALRKMLVDKFLVAVISLPAGVFNPYSGVKTSILILDRAVAKASDSVAFFKVENDGFGLGAQRRAVKGSQLPQVKAELGAWLDDVRSGGEAVLDSSLGYAVKKVRIAEGGDFNLSGERYREATRTEYAVPRVSIGDVCTVNPRKSEIGGLPPETVVSFVPMAALDERRISFAPDETKPLAEVASSYTYFAEGDVLLAKVTPCFENGKAGIARGLSNGIGFGSSEFYVLRPSEKTVAQWIYHCVMHPSFRTPAAANMTGTGGLQRVPRDFVERFEIPLPPLEVQREIVAEIEGYQKVIDGARTVLENYRPHIPIDLAWPIVELGDLVEILDSKRRPITKADRTEGPYPYYGATGVLDHVAEYIFDEPLVLLGEDGAKWGSGEKTAFAADGRIWVNNHAHVLRPIRSNLLDGYVIAYLNQIDLSAFITGVTVPKLNQARMRDIPIPLPPIEIQQAIVAEIVAEQALVDANRELIGRFEKKIAAAIDRIWGSSEESAEAQPTAEAA